MTLQELDQLIKELPELFGKVSHEAEQSRYEWEIAEQGLSLKQAGDTLKLLTTRLEGESATAQATRIKNKVIVDLYTDTMEVLKKKSDYKRLELEADILSKKIMLLCKSADLFMSETRTMGIQEKGGTKLFAPVKSKMGDM